MADLRVAVVRHVHAEHFHYPNEHLGDAACAWLSGQRTGGDADADAGDLVRGLETAADH